MEVFNFMESIVEETLREISPHAKDLCPCDECMCRVAALALNRLPPKYIVTKKGKAYSRIQGVDNQYKADAMRELMVAINEVNKTSPHPSGNPQR